VLVKSLTTSLIFTQIVKQTRFVIELVYGTVAYKYAIKYEKKMTVIALVYYKLVGSIIVTLQHINTAENIKRI